MLRRIFWYSSTLSKYEAFALQILFNLEDLIGMKDQDRLAGISVKAQINVVNIDITRLQRKKKLVQITYFIFQLYANNIIGTTEIATLFQGGREPFPCRIRSAA